MSNTSKGKGEKGSKFWMDTCVENPELKAKLDDVIGDVLDWKSPLSSEEYAEYELKNCAELFGLNESEMKVKFSFWPSTGSSPKWDGIATGNNGRTLYLFEAKAHLAEVRSGRSSAKGEGLSKIIDTMRQVHDKYYPDGDFNNWTDKYYQIGNRLTFLNKIQEMKLASFDNVKLVFLNFVNDRTNGKDTSLEEWKEFMDDVFLSITGNTYPPKDVIDIFFDVSEYMHIWEDEND